MMPDSPDPVHVITLLDRIDRSRREGDVIVGGRSDHLLEWSRVKAQVAVHCLNARAAQIVQAHRPLTSPAAIALQHQLADEIRSEGQQNLWPPLLDLGDALDLLEQPPPVRMEGPDLVHLATVAETFDLFRDHFLDRRERSPLWGEAAVQMSTFSGLSGSIRRALDRDGHIVDAASPLLARLRRAVGGQERAVRHEMSQAMSQAKAKGWTTAGEITLRGDRFCLPLRSGDSNRIPGIVHDRSSTGATLFVEPAQVVRLANELAETRLEIASEEARILFALNRAVEQAASSLREAAALMLELDAVRAGLLWSRSVGGQRVRLSEEGTICIRGGRHPLLMAALGQGDPAQGLRAVVPLDLEVPLDGRALVISGPNAGGKSVALKTVGVFCLLAQCGWDVPAREDTCLPMVRRILVDLGDDQSIAEALSSFSAHLKHLSRFMAEAGPGTLVICDEIGSGTDPHEGTALAFAVLEELVNRGAQVLASTHYGLLKAAVHDHPRMVNAAMDYDETDLQPLFTFRVGDPGTSHAFDIAGRMGFPAELLDRARTMAGEERVQVEKLLSDLDRRARELIDQQQEVARQADLLKAGNRELDQRLKGLAKEKREAVAAARKKAEDLVRQGRRDIEKAVREIRAGQAGPRVVKAARNKVEEIQDQLDSTLSPDKTPAPRAADLKEGMRIRIPHLGLKGRIVEIRGEKITATADGLRLTLGPEAVRPMTEDGNAVPPTEPEAGQGNWAWQGEAPTAEHEIDLRGETGEEGWLRLDRLIDRAIPAGLEVVHVIHGFGTGRLRDHLHLRLKSDPRVASFTEAGQGRGGAGATRVKLRG
jgi:DNA mismatch repair protein MutS2